MKDANYEAVQIECVLDENIDNKAECDPLDGVRNDIEEQKYYKLEETVFAESLDGTQLCESQKEDEELDVIDNIIVQKRAGKINKKYHFHVEDEDKPVCPQVNCQKAFSTMALLKAHVRLVHCAKRRFVCEKCGAQFPTKYQLTRHAVTHDGKKAECPVCHKMLSLRTNLSVHLRSHADHRQHQCEVCNKRFVRRATLNTHLKFVHRSGDLHCEICHVGFKSRSEWSRHVTSHKLKR